MNDQYENRITTEEKRKLKRFNSPFPVSYFNASSAQKASGVLKDISYGGAKLQMPPSINVSPAQIISLGILFPDITLNVSGSIAWVIDSFDKKEIGIKFSHLTDTGKETIYNNIFKYFREEITRKWWKS